jgi:hypothetical protein
MSRLPSEAASRNMSACSAQAMSQVGCRLMVASSANTSLPLAPGRCGDIARAFRHEGCDVVRRRRLGLRQRSALARLGLCRRQRRLPISV